ncbi:Hypothetical predicted protein, partial [Mytilus galloprovincialis]
TILHGVHGLRCLSCQGVIEPRACLHKQECGVGEICYTEQVIDDDLTKYYNVGCRSTQLCDMAKIAFGRRSGELQVCQKCCHTDKCNNQECQNSQGASTNICSKCQDVASPLECQSVVECRSDEICFSQQFVNDNFEKRYNLGCEKKKRCELLYQLAPHHRNLQLCNKCCQGSECNKKLCIDTLMTTAVTIDMTTADPMVNPTAAPTSAITTQASVVTTTAQPPVTTKVPQTSQPVFTTMAPMATTTRAPVTMAPTTQELPTTASFQCIDHDARCRDTFYRYILCNARDQASKDYALATCPKACNMCGSVGSLDPAFG